APALAPGRPAWRALPPSATFCHSRGRQPPRSRRALPVEERMATTADAAPATHVRRPWYTVLYIQVLIAIAIGILVGHFYPGLGKAVKPLGDGFIALIKMMIAPVIFCTVVHGIASMGDLKKLGRVGVKTLVYFEVVSTVALAVGILVGYVVQPGVGFNIDPAS